MLARHPGKIYHIKCYVVSSLNFTIPLPSRDRLSALRHCEGRNGVDLPLVQYVTEPNHARVALGLEAIGLGGSVGGNDGAIECLHIITVQKTA